MGSLRRWRLLVVTLAALVVIGGVTFYLQGHPIPGQDYSCSNVNMSRLPTQDPNATGHPTYQLVRLGPLPPQRKWKPGATMRFDWCPIADRPTTDTAPARVVITGQLAGPYPSLDAAMAAQRPHGGPNAPPDPRQPLPPLQPVAGTMTPIHTDTWSGDEKTSTLKLPMTPGFYIFIFTTTQGTNPFGGSSGIVQVVAS
ncbi:MAG TPA: hypothetical protein VF807_05635 [Ktedonobacterales bacterium]